MKKEEAFYHLVDLNYGSRKASIHRFSVNEVKRREREKEKEREKYTYLYKKKYIYIRINSQISSMENPR